MWEWAALNFCFSGQQNLHDILFLELTLKLSLLLVWWSTSAVPFWLIKKSHTHPHCGGMEDRGERACLYEASHACRAVLCLRDNGCRWLARCRCVQACNGRLWECTPSHGVYFSCLARPDTHRRCWSGHWNRDAHFSSRNRPHLWEERCKGAL